MTSSSRTALGRNIIQAVSYLTLATADKAGVPWCTPVFTAYNTRYEFFWASGFETRHSMNIRENPNIGAVIYDSSIEEGLGEGVYIEGVAEELTSATYQVGLQLLRKRSSKPDVYFPIENYKEQGPARVYKLTPKRFFMLSPKGDPRYDTYIDCRENIDLLDPC